MHHSRNLPLVAPITQPLYKSCFLFMKNYLQMQKWFKMARDTGIKVKVALIGPCQSGKSIIANFLSDATENSIEEYHPTHVVRILELESVR